MLIQYEHLVLGVRTYVTTTDALFTVYARMIASHPHLDDDQLHLLSQQAYMLSCVAHAAGWLQPPYAQHVNLNSEDWRNLVDILLAQASEYHKRKAEGTL